MIEEKQQVYCCPRNLEGFHTLFGAWNPSSLFSAFFGGSSCPDDAAGPLPAAELALFACSRKRQAGVAPPRPNSLAGAPGGAGLSERGGVRAGGVAADGPPRRHVPSDTVVGTDGAAAGGCLRRSSARRAASSSRCCIILMRSRSAARCRSRSSRMRVASASASRLAASSSSRLRSSSVVSGGGKVNKDGGS
jgi:hypothetical protein